jgi:hypothetical protein
MTKKITISLPDDVAETLEGLDNVSARVAEALRLYDQKAAFRRLLVQLGHPEVTEEGVARMRQRLAAQRAKMMESKDSKAA